MSSSSNIRLSDYFMMVPEADRYQWVGRSTNAEGLVLANVRQGPVASTWNPLSVEWLAETRDRPHCDFPIFHPIVRCISNRACEALGWQLRGSMELLPLQGLAGEYVGAHCIRWLDAACFDGIDLNRVSVNSTLFVPTLRAESIDGNDIFGIREMITKVFVSEKVRQIIESNELVGCEFHRVPLC